MKHIKTIRLGLMIAACLLWTFQVFPRDFQFDSSISRPVLENYLGRSISFTELLHDDLTQPRNSRAVASSPWHPGRASLVLGQYTQPSLPRWIQHRGHHQRALGHATDH